jgi:nucleotide sugar dehydrogenase
VKVCVVGLGQIGFSVAQYIQDKGFEVFGYDIDSSIVEKVNKESELKATNIWKEIPKTDVYIICVTTGQTYGVPDLTAVFEVSKQIAVVSEPNTLISIESTILPGTSKRIFKEIFNNSIHLVHVPHRYWVDEPERHGVKQLRVIGGVNRASLNEGLNFYHNQLNIPMHVVSSVEVAEMCKIVENSHRYLHIAFAEDLKMMCGRIGMNFDELRVAMNTKWNVDLPEARDGIGRHCLPKDTRYVISLTPSILLSSALDVDRKYRKWLNKQKNIDAKKTP